MLLSTKSTSSVKTAKPRSAAAPRRNSKPRIAAAGDISPLRSKRGIESFNVGESVEAAQQSKIVAVKDILARNGSGSPEMIESLDGIPD